MFRKSKLRKPEQVALGPRYYGSRVSRDALLADEDDDGPFASRDGSSDDASLFTEQSKDLSEHDEGATSVKDYGIFNEITGSTSEEEHDDQMSDDDEMPGSEEDESVGFEEDEMDEDSSGQDGNDEEHEGKSSNREALRQMMSESQKSVLATISQATKADAEKGQAVRHERQTFDALLNTRIRLQKALIATNSFAATSPADTSHSETNPAYVAAEDAALQLWNQLNDLRSALSTSSQSLKRKCPPLTSDTPLPTLWSHMQAHHSQARSNRRATLEKWASKARATPTLSTARRLNNTALSQTLTEVLDTQLSGPNAGRLVKRTKVPRSCAPTQAEQNGCKVEVDGVFDDADFYQLLLKELVEQRMADPTSTIGGKNGGLATGITLPDVRTRRRVDTKASKGRKLRYVVHEKLQNFMAPEDRGSWGERQADELFGSLLGRRDGLGEEEEAEEGSDDGDEAMDGRLRLFGR